MQKILKISEFQIQRLIIQRCIVPEHKPVDKSLSLELFYFIIMIKCKICSADIDQNKTGEPYLIYKDVPICSDCYTGIIPVIYDLSSKGNNSIIYYIFYALVKSGIGKKKRRSLSKAVFKRLLEKYNFKCNSCNSTENLSIDHIKPVSKGGKDTFDNLQILCKSCNSRKGSRWSN